MEHEVRINIDAPVETVWQVLVDVERWPEWTSSMSRVSRLDQGPFAVGSRVRIKQPRFPAVVWEVNRLEPGRSFTWTAHNAGLTSVASHRVSAVGAGAVATLFLQQSGLLSPVFGRLTGALTRRYIRMEADGLKARSERSPPPARGAG